MRHHIYLVPGFFGFAAFGDFKYFSHVRDLLEPWLAARGIDAVIHYAPTFPTASIRKRAARLMEIVHETAGDDDGPIYLIGHSTGGLDARLAVAERVSLKARIDPEPLAARVRAVVAVSSPHHGTPTAAFFTSVLGQRLLALLSLVTMHAIRLGSIPLPALIFLAGAFAPTQLVRRLTAGGVFDQVYEQVLKDFSDERREEIQSFFRQVTKDQTLLVQLTPEGLDLFDAMATERPHIRRGSVVSQARPPSLKRNLEVGMDPTRQANYALFRALHQLASTMKEDALPALEAAQARKLREAYGELPDSSGNDAMVPTRSQVWGEVVHAAWADHLDVIGHFKDPDHVPSHVDWLRTGSNFRRPEFEAMWHAVAEFLFADHQE